ncbi:hypothetical protein J4466_04555 [Candidatus Pacearchaeota archaeon]|nr:hypothetical protein [Candidatus Pacearchaeota archaeon]
MAEKLNPKKVALSLASVSGIISIVCALLIFIAPETITKLFGAIFHGIDVSKIATTPTLTGAILGIIEVIVIALIAGWLFAVIYNKIK